MEQISQRNQLVLVIDDEEAVREAVCDILQFEGLDVITAVNGENGLTAFTRLKDEVDLILLDLSMPGMGGAQTFTEIKKIDPNVKVIISSGFDKSEASQPLNCNGSTGFLQKPYDMIHLLTIIRKFLD